VEHERNLVANGRACQRFDGDLLYASSGQSAAFKRAQPATVQGEVLRRIALKAAVNTRAGADPVPFYISIEHNERKTP